MGVGVFFDREGLTFICEPFEGLEWVDNGSQFEYDMAWDDFLSDLLHALPDGWETDFSSRDFGGAGTEYAYNGFYSLFVKQCDSGNGSVFVTVKPRECVKNDYFNGDNNALNLAVANMHKSANKVVKCVAGSVGPLRRRTSGWTTGDFWDFEPVEFTASHF